MGLYLHIPFCVKKCAYCDFYSSFSSEELLDSYIKRLISAVKEWGGKINRPINSVYLGGGTPSLLKERTIPLMNAVCESFRVEQGTEITMEINPATDINNVLSAAKSAGVNRLSIGAQSGNNRELKILGRTHTAANTQKAVETAKNLGFSNISLDIMLGLPGSDIPSLRSNLDFICNMSPSHISAYILKIEENTAFYKTRKTLTLPDDDGQAEQYLYMCNFLEKKGYTHYEISNFCLVNKESRHNLKYWNDEEYLGIGPSAHSFLDGERFCYPRDLKAFMAGNAPQRDGNGGDREEYIMLKLRLKRGLNFSEYRLKYGELPTAFFKTCTELEKAGLVLKSSDFVSLTDNGMILSNSVITKFLECL